MFRLSSTPFSFCFPRKIGVGAAGPFCTFLHLFVDPKNVDVDNKQNHNFGKAEILLISVKNNKNIIQLISKIKNRLSKKFMTSDNVLVTRERHRAKLKNCLKEIDNFLKKDQNKDIEIAAEDLRLATRHLGGIVGKVDVEEILDSIFKDFCIGK